MVRNSCLRMMKSWETRVCRFFRSEMGSTTYLLFVGPVGEGVWFPFVLVFASDLCTRTR